MKKVTDFCAVVFILSLIAFPAFGQRKPPRKPAPPRLPTTGSKTPAPQLPVAKVDPAFADKVKLAAGRIDALVGANYTRFGVEPNPLTTDSQFVRRIYLDITGAIPTYDQTVEFLESRDPDKRTKLIDELLNSPGYVSHSFNFWADILRISDRPTPNVVGLPYVEYVKDSLRENKPYDVWVREMLTAEGKAWEDPAAGYVLRDDGMPLDALNNTVRVFLGTQIGCAQCHDHPFDRWTQREFYELAAYTYQVRTRMNRNDFGITKGNPQRELTQELNAMRTQNKEMNKVIGPALRLLRSNTYSVINDDRRRLKLPHDYAYDDGKPNEIVKPSVIFGDAPDLSQHPNPRKAFASWLANEKNPRFTVTIANRLWKRVMGVGQIEPVDDMKDDSVAENPQLLQYLKTVMTALNYNQKEYLRILYNTQTYQRQSSQEDLTAAETYHFPGPILRRMRAEQVWDSLLTLAIYNPDNVRRPTTKGMEEIAELNVAKTTPQQIINRSKTYEEKYGNTALAQMRRSNNYKGQILVRASEQPMPLPPGHFLRQFGQGDRELIEGATTEGSVPQILAMFNGPVTHMMLERGSVIYDTVLEQKSITTRVDAIFLSVLNRRPTPGERAIANREMKNEGASGYGNVIWALLNTREFLFIQ